MKKRKDYYSYNQRLTACGKVLELTQYEIVVRKNRSFHYDKAGRRNSANTSEETKAANRKKTAQRARKEVRDMANANPQLNKFLTLTFAENLTNIKKSHYELEKFIKRLQTYIRKHIDKNYKLGYISVIEFQERGAIHFHILCDLPFIDTGIIEKIWP